MQKKNRKGFTLIELLAVIVILAIIALIAVPVIMNVITKARVSAFEDSAYGIVKAGEMYYTNKLLEAEGMTKNEEFTVVGDVFKNTENSDTLDLSGSIPSSGKVTVTSEGKVALVISNGEYCIQKSTSESKVKAVKQANCYDYKKTANPVFTTSTENASIPACITDNTECSAGTKVGVQVNASQKYDFYIISDNTSENEITLIMDQNLGETVAWSESGGGTGPVVALNYLESQTLSWTNIPSKTYTLTDDNNTPVYSPITRTAKARLITKSETNTLGCTEASSSCPTWLYKNTYNNGNDTNYGYWTSTAYEATTSYVFIVNNSGSATIPHDHVSVDSLYGIRPVITISKTTI